MSIKVAINGYGRIGRHLLRGIYEEKYRDSIQVVAINDLADVKSNAHLTKYDTVHGKFNGDVSVESDSLIINGDKIKIFSEKDPSKLPWKDLGVDVVFECTGKFTSKEKASVHIAAGAKKVLVSAPSAGADATIVYGVNNKTLKASDLIISNGSCTTNCLAPVVKVLNEKIGIVNGLMTTIHSFTNDQVLTDVFHKDLRRARAATMSMIPTKTGAAAAIGLVIPEMAGKLDGLAVRVPTINVSMVDLTFLAARATNKAEIDGFMKDAANGELKGILAVNELPLVSVDFNHNAHSSIYDASFTKVIDKTVKVMAWYDNEWGFSIRMLDVTKLIMGK